ncbi:MAG: helix-turn-helix domain-containing protein [Methylocystis silviterrae]
MIKQHGGANLVTRVVDRFDAVELGAPFKVILHNAVQVTTDVSSGAMVKYCIPDLDGLLKTIAISRVLNSRKLTGQDIKFLRKAVGLKQKDLAKSIEMSPEHLSRCEAGALVMSPASEKLLRIYLIKAVIKLHKLHKLQACKAKAELEDALERLFGDLKPVAVHNAGDVLELNFHRSRRLHEAGNDDADDGEWRDDLAA